MKPQNRVPYTKPIPVKLPLDILKRLDDISKKMGEPRSTVMRMAMRVGLDALEKAFEAAPPNLSNLISQPSDASDQYTRLAERPAQGLGKKVKAA